MSDPAFGHGEPSEPMTRAQYRAWALDRPGRFERVNGVVVAMAPERAAHNLAKANIRDALRQAIRQAGLSCQAFGDGMTVEVDDSDYEPDCVARCGEADLPGDAIAVPDPLIVVEVLSPSTAIADRAYKLQEYFTLPSVRHYLIVWPDLPQVVHHQRTGEASIHTLTITSGQIRLDPPGIAITVEAIYAP
jgi:Uma2 family endonuclease